MVDELNQGGQQTTLQSTQRPTTVTVFGILNIIFAFLGLLLSPISIYGIIQSGDSLTNPDTKYSSWQ